MKSVIFVCILSTVALFARADTLLVYGDSLSAGYGIDPEKGWVNLLATEFEDRHQVVNASISGETSRGGLARLPTTLNQVQPDVLILELGANDGLRGYPIDNTRKNLAAMIELAQQSNIQVVLLGIRLPPNYGSAYTEPFFNQYAQLAEQYQLPYLPFMLDGVAGIDSLMQLDGIHPNEAAQPLIVENIRPLLDPILDTQ